MKKHLSILAIVAGLLVPVAVHAGPGDDSSKAATSKAKKNTAQAHRTLTYYYITGDVPTGSNIPIVIRRTGTDTSSLSPLTSYSRHDLDRTGSEDVATQLATIDPAIMVHR